MVVVLFVGIVGRWSELDLNPIDLQGSLDKPESDFAMALLTEKEI